MKRDRSSKKERRAKKNTNASTNKEEEELVFEDPFVDEYEEEDVMEDTKTNVIDDENEEEDPKVQTWDPMERPLEEGETLNYDSSAYKMFHTLRPEWPSLSFDILKDNLGAKRTKFPLTAFMVTGTQADKAERNKLTVMKVSELYKTEHDEDSDADDDDDEMALDDDPILESVRLLIRLYESYSSHASKVQCRSNMGRHGSSSYLGYLRSDSTTQFQGWILRAIVASVPCLRSRDILARDMPWHGPPENGSLAYG